MADKFNAALEPVSWLFGKWRGDNGKGIFPTLQDFSYGEEIEFTPVGMQPTVEYKMCSWNPSTKAPMHRESGFIKVKAGTKHIAFVTAHNFGSVDLQEGEVKGQELNVATQSFSRTSFYKDPGVKKTTRTLKRSGDQLEQVMSMETANTQLSEHLCITYTKA